MTAVRIGMVNYINTAPIYEEWKTRSLPGQWQITEAPPSTLNQLLAENKLDLGLVSSYEYAARPNRYRILADLSISATGPVGSVFLFSTVAPDKLSGKLVLLTGQSETSVALIKIILEEFHGIKPRYVVGDISDPISYQKEISAVLAIGDEALRLKGENSYPIQLDLADVWNKRTGLPFVFAVFAVREEFVAAQPEVLTAIWQTLIDCRNKGKKRLDEISRLVAPRIPMEEEACYRYLQNIEHTLDSTHQESLKTFFQYLIKRGDGSVKALPLKFFPDMLTGSSKDEINNIMPQPEDKKKFVRDKFASISSNYDLLNSLLSFQVDKYWRWKTTRQLSSFQNGPVLDLCAGTLPLSLELTRQAKQRRVLAVDFCEEMLRSGVKTLPGDDRKNRIFPVCGDGEMIPAPDDTFWGCTVAFGVRNLSRTQQGLNEMYRVLKPGGKLLILEFSRPANPIIKPMYNFYLNKALPKIAGLVSGDKEAYEYLASSIAAFYEPEELLQMIREAGFTTTERKQMTFGIVTLYIGVK